MTGVLGLDIGGAHLKCADGDDFVTWQPFELWRRPHDLAGELTELLRAAPPYEAIAVTMTGELADCFRTKAEGVRAILNALIEASGEARLAIYSVDGNWITPQIALEVPLRVAAANWHALARFAARFIGVEPGLLIDVGSTTTDIIPIVDGQPAARGTNDPERLATGELVYTGVMRTPVSAIVKRLPWGRSSCRVAGETFATSWDAHLVLGHLAEEEAATSTADGRPATIDAAHGRLARTICADREMFSLENARRAANEIARAQRDELHDAAREVIAAMSAPPRSVVVAGQGEFLAREVARIAVPDANVVSLARQIGPRASRAATAYALAKLRAESGAQGR